MFKIKFSITYDGSNYFGWQRQSNQKTLQSQIEQILSKIFQKEILIHGSGRTDRGVHAKGQIAIATLPSKVNLDSLLKSLNALLPSDIRILSLEEAEDDFHPRYSATGKIYRYNVYTKKLLDPFLRHTHYHHPYPLNIEAMKKATELFIGTKNFSSFANLPGKNCKAPDPVRTIYNITIEENESGFSLTYHGSGFLYKMVRNITGSMIEIGEGNITTKELELILENKCNKHGLMQAPAHGLSLEKVLYS